MRDPKTNLLFLILNHFSSQCRRTTVKTGKKGTKKLKCRHEVVAALYHGEESDNSESAAKSCTNCLQQYSEGGVQCKFCANDVFYCSKKCQVFKITNSGMIKQFFLLQDLHWEEHRLKCSKTQEYMKNTSKYILENDKIPDKSVFNLIKSCNAQETMTANGWPRTYSPDLVKCPKCDIFLSPLSKKKRKFKEDQYLLISAEHIIEVDVFTKQCKLCCIIFRPDTLSSGVLNIGEVTLVTVDIFFTLQNTIR